MKNSFHLVDTLSSSHHIENASVKIFVPGWATDCQLFKRIPIEPPFIDCTVIDPFSFSDDLTTFLRNYLKDHPSATFSFFGFSMGSLLISQLIQYLSITTCTLPISNIIFCGLRFSYSSSEIDTLKSGLRLNKKKQLKQFYRACFHSPQEYKLFFNDLGKRYLSLFESTLLLTGLTYLEKYQCLDEQGLTELTASISPTRVRFQLFQGSFDLIAPLTKLEAKTNDADHKSTRCDSFQLYKFETGHIPFFNETSCNRLSDVFDRLKHPN